MPRKRNIWDKGEFQIRVKSLEDCAQEFLLCEDCRTLKECLRAFDRDCGRVKESC